MFGFLAKSAELSDGTLQVAGIHPGGRTTAVVTNARISDNTVTASTRPDLQRPTPARWRSTMTCPSISMTASFATTASPPPAANGTTFAEGGGVADRGVLEMRRTTVADNTVSADGSHVVARGGGLYNGTVPRPDRPCARAAHARERPHPPQRLR